MRTRRAAIAVVASLAAGAIGVVTTSGPVAAAPATGEVCFVEVAYPVALRRVATASEVTAGAARMRTGTTQATFVRGLARSDERSRLEVKLLYATARLAPPDAAALATWTARLRAGARVRDVGAAIISGPEMWAALGQDVAAYVFHLYEAVLDRSIGGTSLAERDYWVDQVAARGREWVARRFFGAVEWRAARVDRLYREILGRAPDASGRAYWIQRLATLDDIELVVNLAVSRELRTRTDRACPQHGTLTTSAIAHDPDSSGPAISGDGATIVMWTATKLAADDTNGRGDVYVWDRADDRMTRLTDTRTPTPPAEVAISDDGDTVVFSTFAAVLPVDTDATLDVYRWDRGTGAVSLLTTDPTRAAYSPEVSADGEVVLYVSKSPPDAGFEASRDLRVLDVGAGTTTVVPGSATTGIPLSTSLSADGSAVAWTVSFALFHWDRGTGTTTAVDPADVGGSAVLDLALSGDGSLIAFGVSDAPPTDFPDGGAPDGVYLWDQATGVTTIEVEAPSIGGPVWPQLSADGSVLTFVVTRDTIAPGGVGGFDLYRRDLTAGVTARIVRAPAPQAYQLTYVDLSADGDHAVFATIAATSPFRRLAVWDRDV